MNLHRLCVQLWDRCDHAPGVDDPRADECHPVCER